MKKIGLLLMMGGITCLYGATGIVNNDVKIREFPSMDSQTVTTRKKGRVIEIVQKVDNNLQGIWYQVPKGYIYEKFITLDKKSSQLPTKIFQGVPLIEKGLPKQEKLQVEIITPLKELENIKEVPLPSIIPINIKSTKESLLQTNPILEVSPHIAPIVATEKTVINTIIQEQNSSTIKNDSNITKEVVIDLYREALTYYKQKNYQKAYTLFDELFSKNLNDVNINFYLGRSGYELGLFDEAILAFDRILFEKPETLRVQFELGRTYIAKENYLDAKKYFQDLTANDKTPNDLKMASEQYLALIDEKISKHTIGGVLIFGIHYDSNVHNSSKNDIFSNVYLPSFNTFVDMNNSTKKEGGVAHQEIAVLNHTYQLSDTMQIKTDGMIFGKFMFENDLKEKNIKMGSITSSLLVQHKEDLTIAYGVFLDNLYVGGENYIQSYGLFPKLNFIQDEKRIIDGYLKYQKKHYQQQANKQKNSTYSELGGTYKFIYDDKFTLIPNILFSKEDGSNKTVTGIDNNSFGIGFGVNIAQSSQLFFLPALNYKITKYEDIDTSYLKKQEDKELNLKFGTTYLYSPLWIVQGDVGYITQSSNIAPNEYRKYNFGINLIRVF